MTHEISIRALLPRSRNPCISYHFAEADHVKLTGQKEYERFFHDMAIEQFVIFYTEKFLAQNCVLISSRMLCGLAKVVVTLGPSYL